MDEYLDEAHALVNKIWQEAFPKGHLGPIGPQACIARAELARIRAEARAEAAGKLPALSVVNVNGVRVVNLESARAAILADEPKEERGAEGPCCKCVEEKGALPCEFCGPPAWEAFQERESSWEPMVRALIGLLPRRERRWLKGVVDAEVERRIEEAGRC